MATIIEVRTKKWGNSIGIILPKKVVTNEKIKENEKIELLVIRKNTVLKKVFGLLKDKWKKSTQDIKDELRNELYV